MKNKLSIYVKTELVEILKERFENNKNRHEGIKWEEVLSKLEFPLDWFFGSRQ